MCSRASGSRRPFPAEQRKRHRSRSISCHRLAGAHGTCRQSHDATLTQGKHRASHRDHLVYLQGPAPGNKGVGKAGSRSPRQRLELRRSSSRRWRCVAADSRSPPAWPASAGAAIPDAVLDHGEAHATSSVFSCSRNDQAALVRKNNQLCAVPCADLRHRSADMRLCGQGTEE